MTTPQTTTAPRPDWVLLLTGDVGSRLADYADALGARLGVSVDHADAHAPATNGSEALAPDRHERRRIIVSGDASAEPTLGSLGVELAERHGGSLVQVHLAGGSSGSDGRAPRSDRLALDATMLGPAQVTALLWPALAGAQPLDQLAEHVERRLSLLALNGIPDPAAAVTRRIQAHLRHDAADPQLRDRWGSSTVIDENTGSPVIEPEVFDWLAGHIAPDASEWPVSNAGILHTYGYLLSTAWTPFGWKADRYHDGTLARLLDVAPDDLTPWAASGTMLHNLTAALDATISDRTPEVVIDERGTIEAIGRSSERSEGNLRTRLYRPAEPNGPWLLIYTIEHDGHERLVTTFAMSKDGVDQLRGDGLEARSRYNVAGRLSSGRRTVTTRN